ncbi:MAG: calcium-binding protein, partial [Pseudomonadota bacterium]
DFLLLGTATPKSPDKSGGFFFKTSVADVTIIDSHVERFDHGVINWFSLGDRQEYRRGYWDPLSPNSNTQTPDYEGRGSEFEIENPAHNLWNHTVIDFTSDNLRTAAEFNGRQIEIRDTDGTVGTYKARNVITTNEAGRADDPLPWRGVDIQLLDDSAAGGLVALWREHLPENWDYDVVLANHIPLAYQDNAYLGQIHFAGGQVLKRDHFLDGGNGIAADIWSGTVLEFEKTDSLGRQVFAYGDFSPLDWSAADRSVTTNEKIIFTREMIDGILSSEGYYSTLGAQMKFVAVRSVFTDRLTGEYVVKEFLVGLDLAWEIPAGAQNLGHYRVQENSVVAEEYGHFYNGSLVTAAPFVVPTLVEAEDTPDAPADALELLRDAEIDTGGRADGYGHDAITGSDTGTNVSGLGNEDTLISDGGGSGSGSSWIQGATVGTEERDIVPGSIRDDVIRGMGGDDYLSGDRGDDAIDGGAGNDTIFGEHGNDTLVGGAGSDVFWMTRTSHDDVILDFNPDEDVIDLGRARPEASDVSVRQEGTDLIISYFNSELRVVDTEIDDLNEENFLLA